MTMPPDGDRERGIALEREGMSARALPFLERALARAPDDAELLTHLANAQAGVGRLADALATVDRALAADPTAEWSHRTRSWLLGRFERDAEALEAAERALALAPRSALCHERMARCMNALDRHREALAAAERAIAIRPGMAGGWMCRGWAAYRLRDNALARASFERAAALDPEQGMFGLAFVSHGQEMIELERRVLALDATNVAAQGNLALGLCRNGDWQEAYDLTRVLIAMRPSDPLTCEVFTRAAANTGHIDEALAMEPRLVALAAELAGRKDEYRAYEGLGHVALARGDFAEAEARYGKALALKPWCCLAVGVGRGAAGRGDLTQARAMLQRADELARCAGQCSLISKLRAACRSG